MTGKALHGAEIYAEFVMLGLTITGLRVGSDGNWVMEDV